VVDADSINEPISLPVSRGTLDLTSSRPIRGATSVTEEEVQQRLAFWLAEVSAEAALSMPRSPGRSDDPPTRGSAS
jgi:hypothetical protein